MDDLSSTVNRAHVSLEQFDISDDISLRLFLGTLTHPQALVIAELFYLPQSFALEKLKDRLESGIQNEVIGVIEQLKAHQFVQFDGKTVTIGKEAKKQLEPYMQRFEEDFEIEFSFLFPNLKQLPVETVPNWFSIHRIMTSFQDAIIEKYLETPLLFQRFTQEIIIDDPYAKDLLALLLKMETFELPIEEIVHHFTASREAIERSILCLEFALVAGWIPASDQGPSRVSLVREVKDLYLNLRKRLPTPSSSLPKKISLSLEQRIDHLLNLLSNQCLDRGSFLENGSIKEWIALHLGSLDQTSLLPDLDLLISLGFVKESTALVVTKPGFDWLAKPSAARKMDLYLRHRPIYTSSHLSDRALKQIERSIFEKQPEVWLDKTELAKSLLWTSGEDGGIHLILKGRNWHYQLPVHSEQTMNFLIQIINWLCEIGYLRESKLADLSSDLVLIPLESRALFIHQF